MSVPAVLIETQTAPVLIEVGGEVVIITAAEQGPAGVDGVDGVDGVGVPVGGTTGQVLAKNSNDDYDTEWVDQTGGSGGVSDGDKGDIVVSGSGAVWSFDSSVVTAAGRALLDDASASAQRTTLGLGTLATQDGTFSGTSSGTNTGDQDLSGYGLKSLPLSQFAATTSAQLRGVLSDETGTGPAVFATAPSLTGITVDGYSLALTGDAAVTGNNTGDQNLAPYALLSGTLAQFASTTSTQLRGVLSDETGTGSAVFATSPTLVTPTLGVATVTSVNGNSVSSGTGTLALSTFTLTVTADANVGGTNTGDVTTVLQGGVAYASRSGQQLTFLKVDLAGTDVKNQLPYTAIAAMTSAQLAGIVSDETGSGSLVFSASPALTGTPTVPTAIGGTNNTQIASTAYVDTAVSAAVTGLLEFQGSLDCSANPNYPAASKGDLYYVSVAGKVGGASGTSVDVGDAVVAKADNAGGTQASVGTSWFVMEHNLVGALLSANNLSDVANAATARMNLGLTIGIDVQAYDNELQALAGVTAAANKLPYFSGASAAAVTDFTSFARTLVDDADAPTALATLTVYVGSNVNVGGTVGSVGHNVALGNAAVSGNSSNGYAVVIGDSASGTGGAVIAIGASAAATGTNSVVIGANCSDGGASNAINVGGNNTVSGSGHVALGHYCTASGAGAVALGQNVTSAHTAAVVLGYAGGTVFTTTADNQFVYCGNGSGSLNLAAPTSTTNRIVFVQAGSWPTATDASRTGRYVLSVNDSGGQREVLRADADGTGANLSLFGAGSYGGGEGVVFVPNAGTNPASDPTGGVALYAGAGLLKFRGPATAGSLSGTNTGDQTITLTGDATGSGTGSFAVTLATVTTAKGGTGLTTYTAGDVVYASATNVLGKLAVGAAGKSITSVAGAPAYADPAGDLYAETDGATITFNMNNSRRQKVTLGGNRTLALSNDADGMSFTLYLKQDGTGTRVPVWWSGIKWAGGVAPTLTTTAGKWDVFSFTRMASGEYLGFTGSLNH